MLLIDRFPDAQAYARLARDHTVIPVCGEILADTETPVSLLYKFYHRRSPVFLLESVEGGERWGRYSFLGLGARYRFRVMAQEVEKTSGRAVERIPHHGRPLAVLRQWVNSCRPAVVPGLPRFWGGLVGSLTYESVSFFETVPNRLPADTSLAHFVVPEEVLAIDNVRKTVFVIVNTFPEGPADAEACYRRAVDRIAALRREMRRPLARQDTGAPIDRHDLALSPRISEDAFRRRVDTVKEHIRAGDIIQAVISQQFTCNRAPDPIGLYRAQRYINPSPYLFFLQLEDTLLVGSSPETMVRLENGTAMLRPIAGTRKRGTDEQTDRQLADELLRDEKERAEHLMLVDLGRNDLGRVAEIGTVQVSDLMTVERYSHVMHLVSTISCDLKPGLDAWDLLPAVFPAGTLSGAPKIRAMEIIAEQEQSPRGPYGGAVGYISFSGDMDMAITIRTACIENDRLTVRAGAGIVADSDPEAERLESVQKAMAIQRALELVASAPSDRTDDLPSNGGHQPEASP
jgi:anthranilate synthase component 1